MRTENNYDDEIDLLLLFKAIWHRLWAVILAIIVVGAAGFSYAKFLITPKYQANALFYVNNSNLSVGSTSISLQDLSAAQNLVDTYIVILTSRTTLNAILLDTGVDYTYEELKEMVSANAVNDTEVFSVNVVSDDPEEAEKIANSIAKLLPEKISNIVEGSNVKIVDYAVVPQGKISPSVTKYTAIGMALGMLISCAVIAVITLMDTKIHDEDYLLQTYDLPVLAVIPDFEKAYSGKYGRYYSAYGRYGSPVIQTEEKTEEERGQ